MNQQNTICQLFAKGDFSSLAKSFEQAGFLVHQPLAGVIQIVEDAKAKIAAKRLRLLISVGIHGDETAPIEMLALLLNELSKSPQCLAVDLMIVVGNLQAIAKAKRFIDVDLNRLFMPHSPPSALHEEVHLTEEARRANQLMPVAAQFFDGHQLKWHLDLHTAIRASIYPTFALVPGKNNPAFVRWLSYAGIAAVVLNPQTSTTFSSYTCTHSGAVSCTAELGRIGQFGKNDLSQFSATRHAINVLLRSGSVDQKQKNEPESSPLIFCVTQELIKRSDAFALMFDDNTSNFTQFAPGTIIATDGETTYAVGAEPEYVLFPNSTVRIGLRAGLMVRRIS